MIDLDSLKDANDRKIFGVRITFKNGKVDEIYPVRNIGLSDRGREFLVESALAPRGWLFDKEKVADVSKFELCCETQWCYDCPLPAKRGQCSREGREQHEHHL